MKTNERTLKPVLLSVVFCLSPLSARAETLNESLSRIQLNARALAESAARSRAKLQPAEAALPFACLSEKHVVTPAQKLPGTWDSEEWGGTYWRKGETIPAKEGWRVYLTAGADRLWQMEGLACLETGLSECSSVIAFANAALKYQAEGHPHPVLQCLAAKTIIPPSRRRDKEKTVYAVTLVDAEAASGRVLWDSGTVLPEDLAATLSRCQARAALAVKLGVK